MTLAKAMSVDVGRTMMISSDRTRLEETVVKFGSKMKESGYECQGDGKPDFSIYILIDLYVIVG